jgi:negative regulator of genetic competence, sporulation and motility
MELIVISESKLKIMLSGADMVKYELTGEGLDCANLHTREAFRHIFADARDAVGFDTQGERLLVQFYTSKNGGGCEIFVTKLGAGVHGEWEDGEVSLEDIGNSGCSFAHGERALLRRVYADGEEEGVLRRCFSFDRLHDLTDACRRLWEAGFSGESRTYIEESPRDVWFLILEPAGDATPRLFQWLSLLSEYGHPAREEDIEAYLAEHGRLLLDREAVETLAGL